jgi:hypothetical protein
MKIWRKSRLKYSKREKITALSIFIGALQPLKIRSKEYTQILEEGGPKQVKIFTDLGRIKEAATQPR